MESIYFDRVVRMILGHMRFVLEEGNLLTLRNEDGECIGEPHNLIPEGHSLVLKSEDLSYITFGPSGFEYRRYNPKSHSIDEAYSVNTDFSQSKYEDTFPLAAYCPNSKKAFFITISKTTREIWIYENGSSEPKKVNEKLPKNFNFKKTVSFNSSYIGESTKKYTIFLSGKESSNGFLFNNILYWRFAIDISKDNSIVPEPISIQDFNGKVSWSRSPHSTLFGKGINPESISRGRGGHVKISTPVDDESMELKDDSFLMYDLKYNYMKVILSFLVLFFFTYLLTSFAFDTLPQSWIDSYVGEHNYEGSIEDCPHCSRDVPEDEVILISFFLLIFLLIIFVILPTKALTHFVQWTGVGIHDDSKRYSKKYNHKHRKFNSELDCIQISAETIALLQPDKIQFYNFKTHQINNQETVQGDFKGYRWLKQNFDDKLLPMYRITDGIVQIKIYDHDSKSIQYNNQIDLDHPLLSSPASLRAVIKDYEDDASEPLKLNSRVTIDHTTTPIRLIITHNGPDTGMVDFYKRLSRSPQVWSNITAISNLTKLLDNNTNEEEVIFELDDKRTLVKPEYFDIFYMTGDGSKIVQDNQLRLRKGNREFAPNLDTAIFLADGINSPVTEFKKTFSDKFPELMRMLWVGKDDSKIHQGREDFNIEDDLPALSFMYNNRLSKFKGCKPKQNTELWANWKDYLPSELQKVLWKIEKNIQWPRKGYAHQMMHGDLTPANVIVNDDFGFEDEQYARENQMDFTYYYDLKLCDFPDVVAREENGNTIYRTENVLDSSDITRRVTSHFFITDLPPKINPMLDLSRFLANLLLKVPFEPSKREGILGSIKLKLRNEAREFRNIDSISMIREQLDIALDWAQDNLRDSCFLAEEATESTWRDLLKAMVFDQCLQILMFWKSYRSNSAIEKDLSPSALIKAFYRINPDENWNQELVKLNIRGWKNELDPFEASVIGYEVSENTLPEIMERVVNEGFPPKTFKRWGRDLGRGIKISKGWFDFRFEDENEILWSCSCYIEDETLIVSSIDEKIVWTDWP